MNNKFYRPIKISEVPILGDFPRTAGLVTQGSPSGPGLPCESDSKDADNCECRHFVRQVQE